MHKAELLARQLAGQHVAFGDAQRCLEFRIAGVDVGQVVVLVVQQLGATLAQQSIQRLFRSNPEAAAH
ncbi:hypothetical protein MASR2M32_29780 [Sphaerotilus sulfidivorans]